MLALTHDNKIYDAFPFASVETAERGLAYERAFIGTNWGHEIFLMDVASDLIG